MVQEEGLAAGDVPVLGRMGKRDLSRRCGGDVRELAWRQAWGA